MSRTLDAARKELREVRGQKRDLDLRERALQRVIEALEPPSQKARRRNGRTRRPVQKRIPLKQRQADLVDYLRQHRNLQATPSELARELGWPTSSTSQAVHALINGGRVNVVGHGPMNTPRVAYKEVKLPLD